jgi:hypothetical protein
MLSALSLAGMIFDIFRLHSEFPKKPEKAFRKFDGCTPYGVHPTLAAMIFLHEESLPENFRVRGAKALLCHDLIEDTTASLPDWCSEPEVESLVQELTFSEHFNPSTEIWNRSENAILLKFYDVVVNLMCVGKMSPERIAERKKHAIEHYSWVFNHYPNLEIIKIAKGLLQL